MPWFYVTAAGVDADRNAIECAVPVPDRDLPVVVPRVPVRVELLSVRVQPVPVDDAAAVGAGLASRRR